MSGCLVEDFRPATVVGDKVGTQNPVVGTGESNSLDLEGKKPCTRDEVREGFNSAVNDEGAGNVKGMLYSQGVFGANEGPKDQSHVQKKKPFNLFKDKHKQVPKPSSPISNKRPCKRSRVELESPFEPFILPAQPISGPFLTKT
ncbi:hypothetical protein Hanom_Chr09g00772111 [Helianthus anomalus]